MGKGGKVDNLESTTRKRYYEMGDKLDGELVHELYETITHLIHFYEGMRQEMTESRYGREQAERDWTALMHNEGMDAIPILAEMLDSITVGEKA